MYAKKKWVVVEVPLLKMIKVLQCLEYYFLPVIKIYR